MGQSSRGHLRGLHGVQSLLLIAAIASVGWMAMRLTAYEERISELQRAQSEQRTRPATSVAYVFNAPPAVVATEQSPAGEAEPSVEWVDEPPEEAAPVEPPPTEAERVAAQLARYEQLSAAFEEQNADDYDVSRARFFTTALSGRLDEIELPSEVRLGDVECRGRMCALDVEFPAPEQIAPLRRATQAVVADAIAEGRTPPLVHFMTLPAPDGTESEGRFFFEWRS